MKLFAPLRTVGIRHRVLLLALIPTLLASLVLFAFTTQERLADARSGLRHEGEQLLDYLTASAEYGMLSGNKEALQQLSQPALKNPSVTAISFLDVEGRALVGKHSISPQVLENATESGDWLFHQPIKLSSLAVDDFRELVTAEPPVIGWVVVELNDGSLRQRERDILLAGVLIASSGMLLAIFLALVIGRTISRPVQQISHIVDRLQHDDLSARVQVEDGGELGELQRGINSLAQQVERTREHLESEVARSTHDLHVALDALELQNRQLEQSRHRAESANKTKDEFLARMSHELRTPLTSVLGFVGLLAKTSLDTQQREYAQVIQRTSSLLLSLIDDLLDFSKLESNAIRLENIEFNLDECVEEVLEMHLPSARKKGIDLIFIPDPVLPERVAGDPTRIYQVLSNLISNAIKFTQQGEVVVHLNARLQNHQVQVELEVRDTGIGISEQQQQHLFKPFSQADTSITRRFGGSGLGLVITRRLMELMGGKLKLSSTAGVGTSVTVELSLDAISSAPPAQIFRGISVLLYDRYKLSQHAVRMRLEYWGCNVHSVTSRRQLETALQQSQPFQHLILSLSGRELKALQRSEELHRIRALVSGSVILISRNSDTEILETYAGLVEQLKPLTLLQRPVSGHALVEALRGVSPAESTPVQAAPEDQPLCGLNILVAEDNRFNQLLVSRMLELQGATSLIANNGEEVLDILQHQPVDLILMDIHMPVMNGIEASRRIRQLPGPEARIPIISLTASTAASDHNALKPLQIFANLSKPIDEGELIRTVQQACGESAEPAQPQPTRLDRYGISDSTLTDELSRQIQALNDAFNASDNLRMRDHSHQLMGLAGLLGLKDLDQAAMAFNQAVKDEDLSAIAVHLDQLKTVINQCAG